MQTNRVLQNDVIDCRQEEQVLKYKDLDHSKTRALREVIQQRNHIFSLDQLNQMCE